MIRHGINEQHRGRFRKILKKELRLRIFLQNLKEEFYREKKKTKERRRKRNAAGVRPSRSFFLYSLDSLETKLYASRTYRMFFAKVSGLTRRATVLLSTLAAVNPWKKANGFW